LGGKGAGLVEMSALGLPVPPGFTITTAVCNAFYAAGGSFAAALEAEVASALAVLEQQMDAVLGDVAKPLLVSVRSGAPVSMPGMMDTILNLGLNDQTVVGLATLTGDPRFAYDSYRRLIQMFGSVVLEVPHERFDQVLSDHKLHNGYGLDNELTAEDWQAVIAGYQQAVLDVTGQPFPQDTHAQLWAAIRAVFLSWNGERAQVYRRLNGFDDAMGTAVTVQAMVFGNRGNNSATGVAFTRHPSTGARALWGEYLINAQGEDVVAGIRTPQPISLAAKLAQQADDLAMEEALPQVYQQLLQLAARLEKHYGDMQDIEFTVQQGKLYLLQTRAGKRSAAAAAQIAVDLVGEGAADPLRALSLIDPENLQQLLHPQIDPNAPRQVIARGLPASPGAASGRPVFTAAEAVKRAGNGEAVILVRDETSPEDIAGMHAAKGVLTLRGGMTSHAAVVARGMGRPCVVGANGMQLLPDGSGFRVLGSAQSGGGEALVITHEQVISLDGAAGEVMLGAAKLVPPSPSPALQQLLEWAELSRGLAVRANADTPEDAAVARQFGATGIGLCRTEHMFFAAERIAAMRAMILADTLAEREAALARLLPMQEADFVGIFRAMAGYPVTIRLLDPPLHEFLPHSAEEMAAVAELMQVSPEKLRSRATLLAEANPMLGHRGCRLAITYPEIYAMQVRAILRAAASVAAELGQDQVLPEIMIPLTATVSELARMKQLVANIATEVAAESNTAVPPYLFGTMIELPRACLIAADLAKICDFFSFGTNDLTQTTWGLSRDDAGSFLPSYEAERLIAVDPFKSLDQIGVGQLMRLAVEAGRGVNPALKIGICGEHGGDPASIKFCRGLGLNYVSCSPYRVVVARLS
jgi:pyruvate,orthophosphate dikinase